MVLFVVCLSCNFLFEFSLVWLAFLVQIISRLDIAHKEQDTIMQTRGRERMSAKQSERIKLKTTTKKSTKNSQLQSHILYTISGSMDIHLKTYSHSQAKVKQSDSRSNITTTAEKNKKTLSDVNRAIHGNVTFRLNAADMW